MPDFTLADSPDSLVPALDRLDLAGVDTEFMREKTYFSELCLVQISSGDHVYVVDPLTDGDMRQFWKALLDTRWVLHSGRQDIEVVYQSAGHMPAGVFDTQVAAALLGYPPQMGYASLVRELFDVDLDKTHTRADWSRRPLTDALLYYAAEDVEYLLPAFELLAERLDQKGRLEWAEEDSALLLDTALYQNNPEFAIDRLKGARNLRGKRRAAAARLAAWRETEALRANRPRQWIARDNLLIEIASRLPATTTELSGIDGIPSGLVRRSGKRILSAVAAPTSGTDCAAPRRSPDEAQKTLLKSMQKKVAQCAADLGLAAETIASKRDLSAVIIGGESSPRLMTGWRRELIGEELLQLM